MADKEDKNNNPDGEKGSSRDEAGATREQQESPRNQTDVSQDQGSQSTSSRQLPDKFLLLRWVLINLPYAFAGLLIGIFFFYIRDYGYGLSTIIGVGTFALLFVIPFYIGERAARVLPPLNIPLRLLHFTAVTGVQMVLVFLIVLTALLKDHVDPETLPEVPVSERLGGTPGLPEEEWSLVPEEGLAAPDEHLPDDREALSPDRDEDVSEADATEDDPHEEDVMRKLFLNILDRAELSLAVADSGELGRFPMQTSFSLLMALAAGFLSWVTFRKRPWRIKFQEAKYDEDDPFRVTMQE